MGFLSFFPKPDLFVTVTCNLKWPEIVNNLLPGKTALDRPDLTTRVFRMYLCQITDKKKILGRSVAHIQVIEFQKRGYPHAHIIIHLANEDKLQDGVDVESYPPCNCH